MLPGLLFSPDSSIYQDVYRLLDEYADQSDRIHEQIEKNLQELGAAEFSGVLRPVFQKDEWKLILAGGVIGTGIGALQVVFLFGGF